MKTLKRISCYVGIALGALLILFGGGTDFHIGLGAILILDGIYHW